MTAVLAPALRSIWDPVHLGINEIGQDVHVTMAERNMLIGGEPGSGKSVALQLIVAHGALSPDCKLLLVDGKRVELGLWRGCAERFIGPSMDEAIDTLEVGDTLQDYCHRLPAEVEITNPRHPLAGRRVPVVSGYRWHGRAWLTVTFPDGHPARIPVQDTNLAGTQVADPGTTVLSVSGIRRLRELVRGRDAAPATECRASSSDALPGRDGRRGAGGEAHVGSPPGTAANESRR